MKTNSLRIFASLALTLSGAALNFFFPIDLAFGIPILPGYILSALAVYVAPWPFGALSPLIAALPTIVMWGHPWALPAALFEGILLSQICRTRKRDVILFIDTLYWMAVGIPLTFFLYAHFLHVTNIAALAEAAKQGVNAVFSSTIAVTINYLAIMMYFSKREGSPPYPAETPTTRSFLLFLMNIVMITPTIVWTFAYQDSVRHTILMHAERDAAVFLSYAEQDPDKTLALSQSPYNQQKFFLYLTNPDGSPVPGSMTSPYADWNKIRGIKDNHNFFILHDPAIRNPMLSWLTSILCVDYTEYNGRKLVAQTGFGPYVQNSNSDTAQMYVCLMLWLGLATFGAYRAARFLVRPVERLKKNTMDLTIASDEDLQALYEKNWKIGGSFELLELRDSIVLLTGSLIHRNSELREAKAEAERQSKNAERYLAFMGHEVKTPVVALKALLDAAEEDPSKTPALLGLASTEMTSLLEIVNDILDESKIKNGNLVFANVPFNLGKNLARGIKPFRILAERRNLSLVTVIPEDLFRIVWGDKLRLNQVLNNLLSNAFKYSERGTITARFSLREQGENRILLGTIQDEGKGIAKENIEQIWKPFATFGMTVSGESSHGLGLPIVKSITEGQGGSVSVVSEQGKGSKFTFTIPFTARASDVQSREKKTTVDTEWMENALLNGKRILLADDQAIIRMTAKGMLECLGATAIDMATDGTETLELFGRGKYDILVLDNYMPGLGGIELSKAIRKIEDEQKRNRSFIILSSSDDIPKNPSFDVSITKPLSIDKIRSCFEA